MADYMVDSTELTAIANAIRAKSGKTGQLIFPGGFMSAVNDLLTVPVANPYVEEIYDTDGNLTGAIMHGMTKIRAHAFDGCSKLESFAIPEGITDIGEYAFWTCTGLTSITFEGTPTTINSWAFKDCTNLTSIKVPWAEGAVSGAPWGATRATITYNYTGA